VEDGELNKKNNKARTRGGVISILAQRDLQRADGKVTTKVQGKSKAENTAEEETQKEKPARSKTEQQQQRQKTWQEKRLEEMRQKERGVGELSLLSPSL
jgi:hypothetical protein